MSRWGRFKVANGRVGFGVLDVEGIMEYQGNMFERPTPTGATVPNGAFTLLSPGTPSKIIALWNNFHALGAKLGKQAPSHPLYLIKPASSVAGPGEAMRRPLELVSRISHDVSLLPGDVIACGTSPGIGSIQDGSTVEVTIDGTGSLSNALEADPGEDTNSL